MADVSLPLSDTSASRDPMILVVAGEVSGDIHAGNMLGELATIRPGIRAFGVGGERLRSAGLEMIATTDELAHMGLIEVLRELPKIRRILNRLVERRLGAVPTSRSLSTHRTSTFVLHPASERSEFRLCSTCLLSCGRGVGAAFGPYGVSRVRCCASFHSKFRFMSPMPCARGTLDTPLSTKWLG